MSGVDNNNDVAHATITEVVDSVHTPGLLRQGTEPTWVPVPGGVPLVLHNGNCERCMQFAMHIAGPRLCDQSLIDAEDAARATMIQRHFNNGWSFPGERGLVEDCARLRDAQARIRELEERLNTEMVSRIRAEEQERLNTEILARIRAEEHLRLAMDQRDYFTRTFGFDVVEESTYGSSSSIASTGMAQPSRQSPVEYWWTWFNKNPSAAPTSFRPYVQLRNWAPSTRTSEVARRAWIEAMVHVLSVRGLYAYIVAVQGFNVATNPIIAMAPVLDAGVSPRDVAQFMESQGVQPTEVGVLETYAVRERNVRLGRSPGDTSPYTDGPSHVTDAIPHIDTPMPLPAPRNAPAEANNSMVTAP
ncbi:hypothetical protein IEO21_01911 [Rhodonia placenta]|uniref:Uncharacterized protein n=1 Tax=Rhodonia placenta TaxID=104341 RepID=A0A8H7U5R7_9APHY|nr:hypothetical protein IEO21_01911 [Postia placenta]